MTATKSITVSGDELTVEYTGSVWVAPCCGAQYATWQRAMQTELHRYLSECGELPDDVDGPEDLDIAIYED